MNTKKASLLLYLLGTLTIIAYALGIHRSLGVESNVLLFLSIAFFVVGAFLPKFSEKETDDGNDTDENPS